MLVDTRHCLLSLGLLLCACAPEFQLQGRVYELEAPRSAAADEPLPMVVLLHGYAASGWAQNVVFPFTDLVDEKNFVLVRPNGTANSVGKRFWNATGYCCDFERTGVDDVAYLRSLIAEVKTRRAIAAGRVYVVGHSNGGFMALRLACEASDVVDGVVSMAGSTWNDDGRCADGRVIPVLLVHGTNDETIAYDGEAGQYPGARETARRFARRAGCDEAFETPAQTFDFLGDETQETTSERRLGCARDVELWTLDGIGHVPSFDQRWTGAVFDWLSERTP
jgi:polyhydroxybutyrate depolymerase